MTINGILIFQFLRYVKLMSRITLKHLRYFEALARHRHFGRAAEASSISQPALSLQMKELEEILGAPLVERGPRQIRLTALGEDFALRARDVLRGVDELASLARASSWPLVRALAARDHSHHRALFPAATASASLAIAFPTLTCARVKR